MYLIYKLWELLFLLQPVVEKMGKPFWPLYQHYYLELENLNFYLS